MKKAANNRALAESVYYILLCLHRPAHGYALMKDIAEMTDNRVRIGAGTLYGALDNLQKKKWIRQLDSDPRERKTNTSSRTRKRILCDGTRSPGRTDKTCTGCKREGSENKSQKPFGYQ